MSAGDVQTQRPPFGDTSLVWCPTCQGWAKSHEHLKPLPEPDTVATLLTERAELRARVTELEAELAKERQLTNQAVALAGRRPGDPGWRAPGW